MIANMVTSLAKATNNNQGVNHHPTDGWGRECVHGLQRPNTRLLCDCPRDKRDQRRACLASARDPPEGAREEPLREDPAGVVHRDRVHRAEEEPDACDGDSIADE